MNKTGAIQFGTSKNETIMFNGQLIEVKPYLSLVEQQSLILNYIEQYFSQSSIVQTPFDYLGAEYSHMLNVIDVCTNIPLVVTDEVKDGDEELSPRVVLSMDTLLQNIELWHEIKSKIKNYNSFMEILEKVIAEIKEQRALSMSLGSVIDNLYEKVVGFLSNMSSIKISDEDAEKVRGLVEEINKSPIINAAVKQFTPEVKVKSGGKKRASKK